MALLSHRHAWSLAVLFCIFPCIFSASSTSNLPPAKYRTSASEVRISFFATDENNQRIENLSKDDFAVVDNDLVIREFRSLARSNETSLDIVLLMDASESVARRFEVIRHSVASLVSAEGLPSGDETSVVTFAGLQPAVLCSGDCQSSAAAQRLLAVKPAGPPPFFDALAYAARFISSRHTSGVRQILILFSDGNDTVSISSARDALEAVIASGTLLYTINLSQSVDARGDYVLRQMAEATGGRSFSMRDGADNVLQTVLADLRASYVVTYRLPNRAPGFHSLRILPKHNLNLRFHCRRGYFYEESQQP